MKILLLDIETAPNTVYAWGFYDQNIGTNQVEVSSYILCWAAKWWGERKMMFDSVNKSSKTMMLHRIHKLLDEADAVVHYNGKKFDIPVLNKEFIKNGLKPPAPYKQVDLYQVCKGSFRFESNKLSFVSDALAIGQKVRHEGFELWVKCMKKDQKAWGRMERYNRGDVRLLESLYKRLLPWIRSHPNIGAYEDVLCCPQCGGERAQRRGCYVTVVMKYPRYHCQDCGKWFRGNKAVVKAGERYIGIAA